MRESRLQRAFKPKPERVVEGWTVNYAKQRGIKNRKMNGLGARSWPDQLFACWGGITFYIEFKKVGEVPTPKQAEMHRQLRELGHVVHVVDRKEQAKQIIDEAWARGRAIMEARRGDQAEGQGLGGEHRPARARRSGAQRQHAHHDHARRKRAGRQDRPHAW